MSLHESIDAFWAAILMQTDQVPLQASVEPVEAASVPYECYRVTYRSLDDVQIVANLSKRGLLTTGSRRPAIITFPGYGGIEFCKTLGECQRGYVILQVYPRYQGESGPAPDDDEHMLRGIDDRHTYNYRGVYMDAVRAVDYLLSREDVDPARIGVMGTSQGGAIALATAALDSRIAAGVAHLPFLCDMRHNPFFKDQEIQAPANLETFDLFDPVHLAARIEVPFLLSSGGKDEASPASTIAAVYAQLRGLKGLFHDPHLPHTCSTDFYWMSWEWIERHLALA